METLVVVSKLKKHIKNISGFSVSSSFIEAITKDLDASIDEAISQTKSAGRKTVMGRDFSVYVDEPKIEEVLVVASKVKKVINEKSELSTSKQVMDQLTVRVQKVCELSIEKAKEAKRKTVMDRDLTAPLN
jgi:histone H3/H4